LVCFFPFRIGIANLFEPFFSSHRFTRLSGLSQGISPFAVSLLDALFLVPPPPPPKCPSAFPGHRCKGAASSTTLRFSFDTLPSALLIARKRRKLSPFKFFAPFPPLLQPSLLFFLFLLCVPPAPFFPHYYFPPPILLDSAPVR